jgi:hypothetical protein
MSSATQRAAERAASLGVRRARKGLCDRLTDPAARADALREIATDGGLAAAACDLLGLDSSIGKLLPSRLPAAFGDMDFRALGRMGRLEHDAKGRVVFRHVEENGSRIAKESWLLVEVYAAFLAGRTRHLSPRELPRWMVRLLVDLGWIEIPSVAAGERPRGIDQRTWERLQTFFDIRLWTDPLDAFPLSRQFLADWAGLKSTKRAKEILDVLRREVLVACEIGPGGRENPTYLYRLRAQVPVHKLIDDNGNLATAAFVEQRDVDRQLRDAARNLGRDGALEVTR